MLDPNRSFYAYIARSALTRALLGKGVEPPCVFQIHRKRGGAQRGKILNTCSPIAHCVKILTPGDLRSGHQVRLETSTSKDIWTCTKATLSDRYLSPEVRSTSRPPILSQWEKFQLILNAIQWLQYPQDHAITGPLWWFYRHISPVTFGRCSLGHPRSPEIANSFSAITFD